MDKSTPAPYRGIFLKLLAISFLFSAFVNMAWGEEVQNKLNDVNATLSLAELLTLDLLDLTKVKAASAKKEKIDVAPATIHIMTNREMVKRGYRNIEDVFSDIPGILLSYRIGADSYVPIIRGLFENNRMKITLNGMTLNPQNGIYISLLKRFPVTVVNHVEVILGPYASLYGRDCFSGIVNIVTKSPEEINGQMANVVYGGTYNWLQGEYVYGQKGKNLDLLISLMTNKAYHGHDLVSEYPEVYSLENRRKSRLEKYNDTIPDGVPLEFTAKWNAIDLIFNAKHSSGVGVLINHNHSTHPKVGTSLTPSNYYSNDETTSDEVLTNSQISYEAGNEKLDFLAAFRYNYFDRVDKNGYFADAEKYYRDRSEGYQVKGNLRWKLIERHEVLAGLSYEQVKNYMTIAGAWGKGAVKPVWTDEDILENYFLNATLQYEVRPIDQVKLVGGIMYEKSDSYADVFLPRLAGVFNVKNLSVKLLHSTGYLIPTPFATVDQIVPNSPWVKGRDDLDPERFSSYEISAGYRFEKDLRIIASGFFNQLKDGILLVKDSANLANQYPGDNFVQTWENLGERQLYGCEFTVKSHLFEFINVFGSYGYVTGKDISYDTNKTKIEVDRLGSTAPHHFKGALDFLIWKKKLNLNIHGTWVKEFAVDYSGINSVKTRIDGWQVADITLSTTPNFSSKLGFSFSVKNVNDDRGWGPMYWPAGFRIGSPIPRRHWNLQATYRF